MKLYELTEDAMILWDKIREADGEITPELEAWMDDLLNGGYDKLDAAAAVVRRIEAQAEECEKEIARLKARTHTFEKEATSLKYRMLGAVDALGGKVKTAQNTFWGQTSAEVAEYEIAADADMATLAHDYPDAFRISYALNKTALKGMPALPNQISETVRPGNRSLRIK